MSDLKYHERKKLETILGMDSGYVLQFTNREFEEFIRGCVNREIYDSRYDYETGSKANRLRRFWTIEPNHVVGKVLTEMLDLVAENDLHRGNESLMVNCRSISDRLLQGAPVEHMDAISEDLSDTVFEQLVSSIRRSIDDNKPEEGLDRLHTFLVKYLRVLCDKRGVSTDRGKPLHSLLGEYIKALKRDGQLESEMSERIMKSSISVLESFNPVRNEKSLAHDNPVLNYDESLMIFNSVTNLVRFIQTIERRG